MRVAVIGTGRIGGTLARKWAAAGHDVVLGARDPAKSAVVALVEQTGATAASPADAVSAVDVVLFAVPGDAMDDTLAALGPRLDGLVVIDATNRPGAETLNGQAAFARHASGATYTRAFHSVGWEVLDDALVGGVPADLFWAGPDGAGAARIEQLITEVGMRPIRLGGPEAVGLADAMAQLWFALVMRGGRGRHTTFKLLED